MGLLEEGVAASSRIDAQAKSLGEYLRAKVVEVPVSLLGARAVTGNLFSTIAAAAPDPSTVLAELPDGSSTTYAEAFALAARFANALGDLGVEPGDRVAVQVEKSWPRLVLYLGCLRAGAVYLPLNTAYTAAEVDYFLGDAEPRVFVCDPSGRRRRARRRPPVWRQRGDAGGRRRRLALAARSRQPAERADAVRRRRRPGGASSTPPARPAAPRARC